MNKLELEIKDFFNVFIFLKEIINTKNKQYFIFWKNLFLKKKKYK